jgi:hypothetical protein
VPDPDARPVESIPGRERCAGQPCCGLVPCGGSRSANPVIYVSERVSDGPAREAEHLLADGARLFELDEDRLDVECRKVWV